MNNIKEKSAPEMAVSETEKENNSNEIITLAVEKINPELKKLNKYAAVIAEPTAKALHGFCRHLSEYKNYLSGLKIRPEKVEKQNILTGF